MELRAAGHIPGDVWMQEEHPAVTKKSWEEQEVQERVTFLLVKRWTLSSAFFV